MSPKADPYYRALQQRRLNPAHPISKIIALSEMYGVEATARAMDEAFEFNAFSAQYIANLLESRARALPEARRFASDPTLRPARTRIA